VLEFCQDELEATIAERERLRAALASASAKASTSAPARIDIEALTDHAMSYLAELAATLERGTPPEQRRFIAAFVTKVDVLPKTRQAKIYYYEPALTLAESHSSLATACPSSQNCTLRAVTIEC